MSYTEALERLLGELQKLNAKVDALDERLRGLEDKGTEVAPPSATPAAVAASAEPPVLREGAFGPMVQRSDPTRHQRSVRQALTLNGAPPEAAPSAKPREASEPEPESSSAASASHQRALERIRLMKSGAAPAAPLATRVEPVAPEPDPQESPESEPDGVRWETAESASETAQAELDLSSALAVDLATRPAQD